MSNAAKNYPIDYDINRPRRSETSAKLVKSVGTEVGMFYFLFEVPLSRTQYPNT
jgi:hypothetical protein